MKVTVNDPPVINDNDERLKTLIARLDELRTITNDFYIARVAWQERAIKAEAMVKLLTSVLIDVDGGDATVELSTGPNPKTLWVYINGVCRVRVSNLNSLKLLNLREMESARLVPRADPHARAVGKDGLPLPCPHCGKRHNEGTLCP